MAGRDRIPTTQSLRRGRAGRCLLRPIARVRQKRSDGGLAIQLKSAIGYLLSAISWRPMPLASSLVSSGSL